MNEQELLELKTTINDSFKETLDPLQKGVEDNKTKVEDLAAQILESNKKIDKLSEMDFTGAGAKNENDFKEVMGKALHELITGKKAAPVVVSDMGGLISESWLNEVFYIPYDYGAFLKSNPRTAPIDEIVNLATEASRPTLTWQSQGSGEGVEAGETYGATTGSTMTRDTVIATIPISRQAVKYSNIALVNYFTQVLREEWAGEIDEQAFNANSTPFIGLLNTAVHQVRLDTTKVKFSDIERKYLIRAIHSCKGAVIGSGGWFCSNSVLGTVHENCVSTQGVPLWDYQRNTLMGFPVWLSEQLPEMTDEANNTDFMIFGSTRIGCVYAVAGFEVAVSEHAEFAKGNIVLRVMVDCSMVHILPKAYCKITTANA